MNFKIITFNLIVSIICVFKISFTVAQNEIIFSDDSLQFFEETPFERLSRVDKLTFGDIDNDGDMDLITAGLNINNQVVVELYENDCSAMSLLREIPLNAEKINFCEISDLDGDNDNDLYFSGDVNDSSFTQVFINNNSDLEFLSEFKTGEGAIPIASDIDSDGDLDFFYIEDEFLTILENRNNSFEELDQRLKITFRHQFGDLDNNGFLDVLDYQSTNPKTFIWYKNEGNRFDSITDLPFRDLTFNTFTLEDVDNDGDLDFLNNNGSTNSSNSVTSELYVNDNLSFTRIEQSITSAFSPQYIFGDVDNNGFKDLLFRNRSSDLIEFYFNYNNVFSKVDLDLGPVVIGQNFGEIRDLNNDGTPEVIINFFANPLNSRIYSYNDGELTLNTEKNFFPNDNFRLLRFEDINGNGVTDIQYSTGSSEFVNGSFFSKKKTLEICFQFTPNNPPTFEFVSEQIEINRTDNLPQTVNEFVPMISDGDLECQTLTFVINVDNENLFSELPQIDPLTGNLTFTRNVDVTGNTKVRVKLVDDGGIELNGIDESLEQTFLISINDENTLVGLEEDDLGKIKKPIFPNPFKDKLFVNLTEESIIHLFTISGDNIYTVKSNANNLLEIPVNYLTQGVYLLTIETKQAIITQRLMKVD